MKKKLLYTASAITLVFALFHLAFPKLFGWNTDLAKLTADNKGIFLMLHVETVFLLLVSVVITFILARKETFTMVDRLIMLFYAGFYLLRIAFSPMFFGISSGELVVWFLCLITAGCYIIPIIQGNKK